MPFFFSATMLWRILCILTIGLAITYVLQRDQTITSIYPENSDSKSNSVSKFQTQGETIVQAQTQLNMGVKTTEVGVGQLRQNLNANGRIAFDQTKIEKLSPRVSGWIDDLFVDTEGERVKKGQALYAMYSPELIEVQNDFLKAFHQGSKQEILNANSQLKALNVDERAIKRLMAQGAPQRSVIFYAQKDGVVGQLMIAKGDFVEPGDNLMAIGSLENVWAELTVFSAQASLIQRGQLISVTTPSYPGKYWEGEIDYILPAVDNKQSSLLFRAQIDNPELKLKPNMPIQADIQLPDRQEALLIPYQSVIRLGHQNRVVWALPDNKFKSVEVTLGESNKQWVEVFEGLEEGDRIVTSAQFLIDSESSKVSDFIRMSKIDQNEYRPTNVTATIIEIHKSERKLLLQHDPIKAWRMPKMTMLFQATESIDFDKLAQGQRVRVEIANGEPLFMVLEVLTIREK